MAVAVGLDIGTEAVRAAAVETGKAAPVLRRFGEMPLPPGSVDAGDIVDPGAVSEAVAALWKRLRLPRKRVVVGIANQRVIVRQIEVPALGEDEMSEALPFLAQDAIPIPVDEAVLDYVPLEEFVGDDGEPMLAILTVAAQREMVEGLTEIAAAAGLGVIAVDLQAFALVRGALGPAMLAPGDGSTALVDIGGALTQVVVVKEGTARFVRILPIGGHHFTESLVTGMSLDRSAAEALKRDVGVLPEGAPEGDDRESRAGALLTRTADALIDDVRGSVNYYLSQAGEGALSKIVVAGNGARLPHLANRLGRALGARIEPARALEHVSIGRVQMTEGELLGFQPVLPASIGLALWGHYVAAPVGRHDDDA